MGRSPYPTQLGSLNAHCAQMCWKYQRCSKVALTSNGIEYEENGSWRLLRELVVGNGTLRETSGKPWTDGEGPTCCLKGVEKVVCPSGWENSTW